MTTQFDPFKSVDTTRELIIKPCYQDHENIITPISLGLVGLNLSLTIPADNDEVIDYNDRLKSFDVDSNGLINEYMECISTTDKGEKVISAMLEVKDLELLKPFMEGAATDLNSSINTWITVGKAIGREVSFITFNWYDLDKTLEMPIS